MTNDSDDVERRFPRRFLLTASAAVAAMGVAEVVAPDADAAKASTAWKVGGNASVEANGKNFLGPTNLAPLVFKTRASHKTPVTERMRITPGGAVGVGTHSPGAQLDVRSLLKIALRGITSSKDAASVAVNGVAGAGTGVAGTSSSGTGVAGTSTDLTGLSGEGGYCGARGVGGSYGGIFSASGSSSIGVYGSGPGYGLYGSGDSYGCYGTGGTAGLRGAGPTGVSGTGSTVGVSGATSNVNGNAVLGDGGQYGVRGMNARTAGTRGDSSYVGAWGQAPAYGVYGLCTATGTDQGYGLFGQASNSASFAVWAQGNAHVAGTLSKAAGSFKIDHPLAPDDRWLSHSFVESPDMMNVYNGNVVLDSNGEATVELPEYFGALNREFRYQLTPIGAHAPVYVASKVKNNTFAIAGGVAGLEVSWQVTGIRQDDYAREHPIVVDTPKSAEDSGTRQFVAPGSSAKKMHKIPVHTVEPASTPHLTQPAIPTLR